MKILITGAAGFIGMHAVLKFAALNYEVWGLDNINSYYEPELKHARLEQMGISTADLQYNKCLQGKAGIKFVLLDIQDAANINALFAKQGFDYVINLAAQAGVRYSITNPRDYIDSNIIGFYNILEACRNFPVKHLIFASSSSVYGNSEITPFSENANTDSPVSLYAATKKSNEAMAHAYTKLYNIAITGLRFFTVYGPWGRPDMAPVLFAKAGVEKTPIKVFNNGDQKRDFTFIDDIIQGIVLVAEQPVKAAQYQVLNIGNGEPVALMDFIHVLEANLGHKFDYDFMPAQKGDVSTTYADTSEIEKLGYRSTTSLNEGIPQFIKWFKEYYNY